MLDITKQLLFRERKNRFGEPPACTIFLFYSGVTITLLVSVVGETFGVATAEAAAAGVPIAGFASCGVLESAGDNSDLAGWPASPSALAQAAARLLRAKVWANTHRQVLGSRRYCHRKNSFHRNNGVLLTWGLTDIWNRLIFPITSAPAMTRIARCLLSGAPQSCE